MKKIILPILCLLYFTANAQITVNSNTLALSGKIAISYTDSTSSKIKTGGNNKIWDFSTLKKEQEDTLRFFNLNWFTELSSASSFSNLVVINNFDDGEWTLLNKTQKSLDFVGFAEDTGGAEIAIYRFKDNLLKFPLTNTSSYKDTAIVEGGKSELGIDPDGPGPAPKLDSLRSSNVSITNNNAIGWGKVKLANAAMVDAIMLESTTISELKYEVKSNGSWSTLPPAYVQLLGLDNFKDTSKEHTWWSEKEEYGFPLISYNFADGDTSVFDVQHLKGSLNTAKIANNNISQVIIFPNPTNNILNFKNLNNANAAIKILDTNGKIILNTKLNNNSLNLENIAAGLYTILLLDGNTMHQFKITKQ